MNRNQNVNNDILPMQLMDSDEIQVKYEKSFECDIPEPELPVRSEILYDITKSDITIEDTKLIFTKMDRC